MTAWPQAKINRLSEMWNTGTGTPQIAEALGTTVRNVNNMVRVYRGRGLELALRGNSSAKPVSLRDHKMELRPCLGFCGGEFYTTVEIRVCKSCTRMQRNVA